MGRARQSGAVHYDLEVSDEEYRNLQARAEEQGTTIEEIVRADLLSPANKERLVPKARKLVRHATITVKTKSEYRERMNMPTSEPFLDD